MKKKWIKYNRIGALFLAIAMLTTSISLSPLYASEVNEGELAVEQELFNEQTEDTVTESRNEIESITEDAVVETIPAIKEETDERENDKSEQKTMVRFELEGAELLSEEKVAGSGLAETFAEAEAKAAEKILDTQKFKGWRLDADIDILYTCENDYLNITTSGEKMTFHAELEVIEEQKQEEKGVEANGAILTDELLKTVRSNDNKNVVTFYVGDEIYEEQVVLNGTKALEPESPEIPENMNSFDGWYTAGGKLFDFTLSITGELNLYARFSDELLVMFMDNDEGVYESQKVLMGECATKPEVEPVPENDTFFQYWYLSTDDQEVPDAFDFENVKIYDNIILKPYYSKSCTVFFHSNSTNKSQYVMVESGSKVKEMVPEERSGYKFAFWSENSKADPSETDERFDFDTKITESTNLYAIWEAKKVGYQLVYWVEKANLEGDPGTDPDKYEFSASKTLSASASDLYAGQVLSSVQVRGIAEQYYNEFAGNNNKALRYAEYAFAQETTLDGDGKTVINVYYKRVVFTLQFKLNSSTAKIVDAKGNEYSDAAGKYYTSEVKYGQIVSHLSPQMEWIQDDEYVLATWHVDGYSMNGTQNTLQEYMIPSDYITNGNRTSTLIGSWVEKSRAYYGQRRYYIELTAEEMAEYLEQGQIALDIDQATHTYDAPEYYQKGGKVYRRHVAYDVTSYGPTNVSDSNGFYFTGIPGTNYEVSGQGNASDKRLLKNSKNDSLIVFFYTRKNYTLTLNALNGTLENPKASSFKIKYGDFVAPYITDEEGKLFSAIPPEEQMTFEGWYLDSQFLIPYDPENYTMPSGNSVLFAKYSYEKYLVNFYDKVGNQGTKVDAQQVERNKTADDSEVYEVGTFYAGLGQFLGWGYYPTNGSVLTKYNYNIPVTEDMNVYGLWKTDNFTLTYDAGKGSGTVPVDKVKYKGTALAPVADGGNLTAGTEVFVGWQVDGVGKVYYPGSRISLSRDTTLVATYADASTLLNVIFDENHGASPETKIIGAQGGTKISVLGEDAFIRAGYTLVGWSKNAGEQNAVHYGFEDEVTVPDSGELILYAVWEETETNRITFKVEAGKESWGYLSAEGMEHYPTKVSEEEVCYEKVGEGECFTEVASWPNAIANDGYTFVGWAPKSNPQFVEEDLTFVALFAKNITLVVGKGEKVYGANDPTPLTTDKLGVDGLLEGDEFSYTPLADEYHRNPGEDVNAYPLSVEAQTVTKIQEKINEKFADNKYVITGVEDGEFEIVPRKLSAQIESSAKTYSSMDPKNVLAGTITVTGLLLEDRFDYTPISGDLVRVSGENVGSYEISLTQAGYNNLCAALCGVYGSNYFIDRASVSTGKLEIQPLAVHLTALNNGKVFGASEPKPITKVNVQYEEVENPLVGFVRSQLVYSVYREKGEAIGRYSIIIRGEKSTNPNYLITTTSAAFTISTMVVPPGENKPGIVEGGSDPNVVNVVPGGEGSAVPRNTGEIESIVSVTKTLEDSGTVQQNDDTEKVETPLSDTNIPISEIETEHVWALLNLLLAVSGMLLMLFQTIMLIVSRRKREEEEFESEEVRTSRAQEESYRKRVPNFFLAIFALLGAVVFFLTEDVRLLMVVFDKWTILMVLLFVGALASFIVARKKKNSEEDEISDEELRELAKKLYNTEE